MTLLGQIESNVTVVIARMHSKDNSGLPALICHADLAAAPTVLSNKQFACIINASSKTHQLHAVIS